MPFYPTSPQRIMIFGRPGSGKSTFALAVHQHTGLPLYHLDRYFFKENWQERPQEEFLCWQQEMVIKPQWIMDGNSIHSLEMRYQRSDLVVYFNFPKWLCLIRLFKRRFFKDLAIQDRAVDCPEILRWRFIRYMWTFEKRVSSPLRTCQQRYPHIPFIELRSSHDVKKLPFWFG